MATPQAHPLPARIPDPVTYQEASALLKPTGHPAPEGTLRRWVRAEGLDTMRVGKRIYVSWSAILRVHRDRTAVKLRASSNWP